MSAVTHALFSGDHFLNPSPLPVGQLHELFAKGPYLFEPMGGGWVVDVEPGQVLDHLHEDVGVATCRDLGRAELGDEPEREAEENRSIGVGAEDLALRCRRDLEQAFFDEGQALFDRLSGHAGTLNRVCLGGQP